MGWPQVGFGVVTSRSWGGHKWVMGWSRVGVVLEVDYVNVVTLEVDFVNVVMLELIMSM